MRTQTIKALNEAAKKIDFNDASFSFRRLYEAAERISDLTEANVESSFGYLLRSAVQEFANEAYKDHPTIHTNLVTEIGSKRRSEIYGGLYRPNLPKQVDAGEPFQDTSFKGFERELINYKFGILEKFERELFDDDQTGQVRARAANIGEGFKVFEEIYVLSRLFNSTTSQEGVDVTASTYGGGTVFSTAIGNRPSSYAGITQAKLEEAHIAIRKITDPLGRKFLVVPTALITGVDIEFEAARIIGSPAMANTASSVNALQINPLHGRYTIYSSPFISGKAWMIGDPKRGFVKQVRDPMEVVQENGQSGDGFRMEVYAFRARERFEADWIEPRFAYVGNDGSI